MSAIGTSTAASSFTQRLFRTRAEDRLPLTIEHQRVYILPTRRGLAYLFSLLIMLIASVNYALSLGYALCFLLTGLFAASLLHTYRNVAGIACAQIRATNAFAGERVQFHITLKNHTHLDRVGVLLKSTDTSDVVDIKALEQSHASLFKSTNERGIRKLGRITITSTYPLGLWRTWCYVHTNEEAIVYPAPEASPPAMPTQTVQSQGDNAKQSNQGDIAGLRDYQPGDALSSIAWKAAARGQGLFVKTFEDEQAGGDTHLTIALTGLQDTEQQLSRLSSWVLAAERAQIDYSFELNGTQLPSGRGDEQQQRALSALALHALDS